ncbi:MAG: RHS repeat-associated core domain-containing protein, partial [Actinomycetota bacterium]
AGNLVAITRPDGSQVLTEYNDLAQPVRIIEPDGSVWERTYDEVGNLVVETDPMGATTSYDYDERGHLTEVTDALGYIRRIETDAAGLPISVTDPIGATTRYTRDAFGRVVAITDPLGGVTRLGWTTEGKLASRSLPDGATERWSYDGENNLVEYVDSLGQTTRTEIGPFDLPMAQTGPGGARLKFSYDTELRLVAVTNPQRLVWRYEHDAKGNLVKETDFNGRVLTYTHDAAGQLVERTNGAGETTRLIRDLLGNVVEQIWGEVVSRFSYDAGGRLTRATNDGCEVTLEYDPVGRVVAESCNGRSVTSTYDPLGRRVQRHTPSGAVSAWEYGPGDQPVTLHAGGQSLRFVHDELGREVQRRLGEGVAIAQSWDACNRLASQALTVSVSGSTEDARLVQHRSYTYRADGYVVDIDDLLSGRRRIDLDPGGRITAVRGPAWTERYAYDPAGNVTFATWPEPAAAGATDALDARGECQYAGTLIRQAGKVRYEHDAQGRVVLRQEKRLSAKPRTWRYFWDSEDRLRGVVTPDGRRWRYRYDPLGRRIAKERLAGDGETVVEHLGFVWDGLVLAEQTHADVEDSDIQRSGGKCTTWDWEPGTFRPLTQRKRRSLRGVPQEEIDEEFRAIVTDLAGTPTELVTPEGDVAWHQRATVWGIPVSDGTAGAECPLRFPGQYFDAETQSHYNFFRHYDPYTARYLTSDPVGLAFGLNPYAYVATPYSLSDPLGLGAYGLTRVGRWMSPREHAAMVRTGEVQVGAGGTTHVAHPANPESYMRQAAPGSHYVEFDVPANSLSPAGRPDWAQIPSPDHLLGRLAAKRGTPVPSPVPASNIVHHATKLS